MASSLALRNHGRHPSWFLVTSRSKVQCIDRISNIVGVGNFSNNLLLLRLGCYSSLFPLSNMGWTRQKDVDLCTICLEFSSSLGEYPVEFGVRRYCIKNSCKALLGGRLHFFNACLNVCTRRSAAPFVLGW